MGVGGKQRLGHWAHTGPSNLARSYGPGRSFGVVSLQPRKPREQDGHLLCTWDSAHAIRVRSPGPAHTTRVRRPGSTHIIRVRRPVPAHIFGLGRPT